MTMSGISKVYEWVPLVDIHVALLFLLLVLFRLRRLTFTLSIRGLGSHTRLWFGENWRADIDNFVLVLKDLLSGQLGVNVLRHLALLVHVVVKPLANCSGLFDDLGLVCLLYTSDAADE